MTAGTTRRTSRSTTATLTEASSPTSGGGCRGGGTCAYRDARQHKTERSQRATQETHNPPCGPAPDVRDCRIRHGGWLLVLCLTMGGTGKLRGRPESRACRCGGGAPLPGSSTCPDWPTRSQAEWRLRHARDRCCRCVSVGTSTRRRSVELAARGHRLSSTCVACA